MYLHNDKASCKLWKFVFNEQRSILVVHGRDSCALLNSVKFRCCAVVFFFPLIFSNFFLKSNIKMSTEAVVGSQYVLQRDCKKFFAVYHVRKNEVLSRSCTKKRVRRQHAPQLNLCYVNCAMLLKNVN